MFKKLMSLLLCLSMILTIAAPLSVYAENAQFTVERLQTENMTTPLGIDDTAPRFSWQMQAVGNARNLLQKSYQIKVATSEANLAAGTLVWDSGVVEDGTSVEKAYAGTALAAKTRYYWNVTVTDTNGNTATSATSWLETGLMQAKPFDGIQWLTRSDEELPAPEVPAIEQTSFTIDMDVRNIGSEFGIAFGYQDASNPGFFYNMSKNSTTSLQPIPHNYNNGWSAQKYQGAFTYDHAAENHFTVKVVEGAATVYVNDTQVASWDFGTPFPMGKIGVRRTAEIDNVKVTLADGTVFYSENFNDADNISFPGYNTITEDGWGKYTSNIQYADYNYVAVPDKNFTIEFTGLIESGALGLTFGGLDASQYYMWQFQSGGALVPHSSIGQNLNYIAWYNGLTDGLTAETAVKIEVNSGTVKTYINDTLKNTYSVGSAFSLGRVGIRQGNNETAYLKNLTVTMNDGRVWSDLTDENTNQLGGTWDAEKGMFKFATGTKSLVPEFPSDEPVIIDPATQTDFTVETRIRNITSAAGIVFGYSDSSNFYFWQIQAKTDGTLNQYAGHKALSAFAWQSLSSHTVDMAAGFDVKLEVTGGTTVKTYINGVGAGTKTLSAATTMGQIGVRHSGSETAEYDYLRVSTPEGVYFEETFDDAANLSITPASTTDGWGKFSAGGVKVCAYPVVETTPDPEPEPEVPTTPTALDPAIYSLEMDMTLNGKIEFYIGGKDAANYQWIQMDTLSDKMNVVWNWCVNGTNNGYCIYNTPTSVSSDLLKNGTTFKIAVKNGKPTLYVGDKTITSYASAPEAFKLGYFGWKLISGSITVDNIKAVGSDDTTVLYSETFDADNGILSGGTLENGAYTMTTKGKYICAFEGTGYENADVILDTPAPMFHREFTLNKATSEIATARLYMTAGGFYEPYLNGVKATDTYFNPGRTTYNKRLMYQTFDVKEFLQDGDNAMGVVLGHGWWNRAGQQTSGELGFVSLLEITYTDGTKQTVTTDDQWICYNDGPVRDDHIFDGQIYDANKEVDGWAEVGLDTTGWCYVTTRSAMASNIVAQEAAMQVEYDLIQAQSVNTIDADADRDGVNDCKIHVYDFGQNVAGIVRLDGVSAPAGTTITMRHGEAVYTEYFKPNPNSDRTLEDYMAVGAIWTDNMDNGGSYDKAQARDVYTFKSSDPVTYEPSLIYHGFQYMELAGVDEPFPIDQVYAVVLASDLEQTGTVDTDNELVDKLVQNTLWSQIDNFLSVPTDCPQRNERQGWTGDAATFALAGSYLMDINAFYQKYERDIIDLQKNGIFPEAAPGWTSAEAVASWSDSGVMIPWDMYRLYGNKQILEESYAAMKKYVNEVLNQAGSDYIDDESTTYGDWTATKKAPKVITETAFGAYICRMFANIAKVLDNTEDYEAYMTHANKFRDAWNEAFVRNDENGFYIACDIKEFKVDGWGYHQSTTLPGVNEVDAWTPYILALEFDLIDPKLRDACAAKLVERIEADNYSLTTGFLGTPRVLSALSNNGYTDIAYKLLESTNYPSWLYEVENGATTMYEYWHGHKVNYNEDGSIKSETYQGSLNHFAHGSVISWLFTDVAGIKNDDANPGYKHIQLQPRYSATSGISRADISYNSQYGAIDTDWNYDGSTFTYNVTIPANTTATLTLPLALSITEGGQTLSTSIDGVNAIARTTENVKVELGSGTYAFTVSGEGSTVNSTINGANIRVESTDGDGQAIKPGIRFGTTVKKDDFYKTFYPSASNYVYSANANLQFGTIVMPTFLLEDGKTVVDYYVAGDSLVLDIPAERIYEQDANTLTYTGVVVNIPETVDGYTTVLQMASYTRYRASASDEWIYIFSTDVKEASYYQGADEARNGAYSDANIAKQTDPAVKVQMQATADKLDEILAVLDDTGWITPGIWY